VQDPTRANPSKGGDAKCGQHALTFGKEKIRGKETAMERAMHYGADLGVQHRLEEYALPGDVDIPGDGRGAKSKMRVLRLVMTPAMGCELLKRLKSDPLVTATPVIVLTH